MRLDPSGVAITLIVAFAVAATGVAVIETAGVEPYHTSIETEAFEEYCHDRFGDDGEVYVANVVGGHGGYHCDHDDGLVHMHNIPDHLLRAYANGSITTDQLTEEING